MRTHVSRSSDTSAAIPDRTVLCRQLEETRFAVTSTNHNRTLNRDQPLLNVSGSLRLLLACLMGVFSILQWVLPVACFLREMRRKIP